MLYLRKYLVYIILLFREIKVAIVEDDPLIAMDLKESLNQVGMNVVSVSGNYSDALHAYQSEKPDVILLDIVLKGEKDGIDLGKHIRKNDPQIPIIFITGNSDSGTKSLAFNTNPSAFLTKPFIEQNLILAIELALDKYMRESSSPKFGVNGHVFLKKGKRFNKVQTSDIHYVKAEGSYSKFITNEEEYLQSGNLGFFEIKLPDDFIRVHKSFIVNYKHIKSVSAEKIHIENQEIPIGRMYKENVRKLNKN